MKILVCCAITAWAACISICYAADALVGEAYVVMDQKALDLHINEIPGTDSYETKKTQAITKAQADIQYIFSETNKILSTLEAYGVNFQVKLRAVRILDTNVFPSYTLLNGRVISDVTALNLYSRWLTQQEAYAQNKYDFAVLLTGSDISGSADLSTTGVATIGTICNPLNALSVIEYNGTYSTVVINAHNIGLLLGTTNGGAASDRIMAFANAPKHKNRWNFDECNAFDIKEFLPSLKTNCLLDTSSASTTPVSSYATYSGRLFDSNVICERTLNDTRSYTCLSTNLYNNGTAKGDAICQQLYCQWPGTPYCIPAFPSDGMICDNRKRCDKGKCVADTSATSATVDSECVLGDQKRLVLPRFPFNGTCPEFIAQEGRSMCYNSVIENFCCATCKRYKTNILGCEYGDKNYQCPSLEKSIACSSNNAAVCCSTCNGAVRKRSTREDISPYSIRDDSHREAHIFEGFKARFQDFSKKPRYE
ncbi:unnamed protein product [Candidula unifasciata]|uniref:Peptidase M12B domain-containing protein n=1 Tax=Candidula unifasciata TaxID=100452 RepID=A0A8S3ZIW9_9EUPU|nr:unnamed protein product [Candidula unifasciata]